MAAVEELIRIEADGALSFGNHRLQEKAKLEGVKYHGDFLKVKTYKTMTKLEKNGMFVYESVPGTSVNDFKETETGIRFTVEGEEDAQLTIGLEAQAEYEVKINGESIGTMPTNVSGKLNVGVDFGRTDRVLVEIFK
ncbi:MAG: endosialidase [Lachnospiraceae bacterium]|nr:endosialidase [Lachnospiraceae bacterium]